MTHFQLVMHMTSAARDASPARESQATGGPESEQPGSAEQRDLKWEEEP